MTTESFEFLAELREDTGKKAARRMRRLDDKVLGTVYGAGKAPQSIALFQKDILKAFENEGTFSSILTLKIGDKEQKVILKGLQRHHTKPKILHVDFQRIKSSEKLTIRIPLHFTKKEECAGVKAGGIISHLQTDVEIRCLPSNLPEYIEVDMSKLNLDESFHLSDLKLPSGVELVTAIGEENNLPIVNVHLPRVSKADIEAEASEASLAARAVKETRSSESSDETVTHGKSEGDQH
ncbi:MAG: 50S ribosomal protein L25/general stress protein Ctc [Coxiella endosymbiont of Haemaphysalis qinghaiensis]